MGTYERRDVLKAICITIFGDALCISQNEGNLNDASQTRSHERVPKHSMNHRAQHQMLRMRRHSPTGDKDDETRNEVPLRSSISFPAEPDPSQSSAPPDNAHSGVLDIVSNPGSSPSMLRERINATPSSD